MVNKIFLRNIKKKIWREKWCFMSNLKIGYFYNKKNGNFRKVLYLFLKCCKIK